MLGFGATKVRMAIISGDLRSVKDGRSVASCRSGLTSTWRFESRSRRSDLHDEAANGEGSIYPYRNGYAAHVWITSRRVGGNASTVYGTTREVVPPEVVAAA